MDPREKRDDESWAEYGARMASMGIAPEVAAVPLAAGIRRPGGIRSRTLTPEQVAVRDANRLKVENQQLSRNIQRIAAEETPVQSRSAISAVKRGDTSLQEADDLRRKEQAAIEKQTRVGGKVVKALAPFAKVAGPVGVAYEALRSEPAVASELPPGVIPGDFRVTQAYPSMDNVYTDPTAMAYAGVTPPGEEFGSSYAGPNTMGAGPDYSQMAQDWGDPTMMSAPTDPTGGLAATDPSLQGITDQSLASLSGNFPAGLGSGGYISPTADDTVIGQSWDDRFPTIAPDFSSGDFDLGSIEALKAAPFGQVQPVSYYDTYAAAPTVEDFTASAQVPNVLSAAFGQDKTIANTGLINALAARDFFDSPLGEQKGHLKGTTFGPSLEQMGIMSAQDWIENINNVRPSDLDVQYTGGIPTKAVIDENYFGPFDLQTTINPTVPSVGAGYSTVTHPAMQNVDYSSALADPNITVQATIDAQMARETAARELQAEQARVNEISMGRVASHPGQGGHIGGPTDPDITIPEMLARQDARTATAVMAPRQDVMPTQEDTAAIARQNVINAQMVQEATNRQRQEQAAVDAHIAASVMAPRQDAMPQAPAGPTPAQIAAQVAAAEQAHRDQQASARQALQDFYNSRAYQQEGASTPAGLIDVATEIDTFATINEQGGGYQGGYADMGGFEGYR